MLDKFPTMVWVKEDGHPVLYSVAHRIPESERASRPYRITTSWTFPAQPNGFPVQGGLQEIHKLEDRLISQLAMIDALYVGHVVGQSRVTFTCYARQMADSTISVKTGLLSNKVFDVTSHRDPEWTFYQTELESSPRQIAWSNYLQLTMTLKQHGDVAEKVRPVDFTLLLPSQLALDAAVADAEAAGFRLTNSGPLEDGQWLAEVQKESAVTMDTLMPHVEVLEGLVQNHGGEFDGWACPVTT